MSIKWIKSSEELPNVGQIICARELADPRTGHDDFYAAGKVESRKFPTALKEVFIRTLFVEYGDDEELDLCDSKIEWFLIEDEK